MSEERYGRKGLAGKRSDAIMGEEPVGRNVNVEGCSRLAGV